MSWLDDLRSGSALPLVQAPMAGSGGPDLARAVSATGALGTVSVSYGATTQTVGEVAEALDDVPFGIGLMNWQQEDLPGVLEACVETGPALLSVSLGDPTEPVRRARAADPAVPLVVQVGTREEALQALDLGVDLLVARGSEGGGHGRGEVSTFVLLQEVLELAGPTPVLAAGGVATARGVAAALAAGAAGVWVGTAFLACRESLLGPALKEAVRDAGSDGTTWTRVFDVAQRLGWPEHLGGRALRNDLSARWQDDVDGLAEVIAAGDADGVTESVRQARAEGDPSLAPVYAGEGVGLAGGEPTAAEVVADLMGYREHLLAAVDRTGDAR